MYLLSVSDTPYEELGGHEGLCAHESVCHFALRKERL